MAKNGSLTRNITAQFYAHIYNAGLFMEDAYFFPRQTVRASDFLKRIDKSPSNNIFPWVRTTLDIHQNVYQLLKKCLFGVAKTEVIVLELTLATYLVSQKLAAPIAAFFLTPHGQLMIMGTGCTTGIVGDKAIGIVGDKAMDWIIDRTTSQTFCYLTSRTAKTEAEKAAKCQKGREAADAFLGAKKDGKSMRDIIKRK